METGAQKLFRANTIYKNPFPGTNRSVSTLANPGFSHYQGSSSSTGVNTTKYTVAPHLDEVAPAHLSKKSLEGTPPGTEEEKSVIKEPIVFRVRLSKRKRNIAFCEARFIIF